MRILTAPVRAWTWFWFRPIADDAFVLLRTVLGATIVVWVVTLAPDLLDFQGSAGLVPDRTPAEWQLTAFRWVSGDAALVALGLAALVGGLCLAAGRLVRLGSLAAVLGLASIQQDNPIMLNAGDDLLRILTVYVAVVAWVVPASGARRPLLWTHARRSELPAWTYRLFQIQLTVIYLSTVAKKAPGERWHDGTAALWALDLVRLEHFWLPSLVRESLVAGQVFTWGTLALEAALPVLLWIPKTRKLAIVLGVGMHAAFSYAMRLGVFSVVMAVAYCSFLPPETARRFTEWVERRLTRGSPATATRAPTAAAATPRS